MAGLNYTRSLSTREKYILVSSFRKVIISQAWYSEEVEEGGSIQGQPHIHSELKDSVGYMRSRPLKPTKNNYKRNIIIFSLKNDWNISDSYNYPWTQVNLSKNVDNHYMLYPIYMCSVYIAQSLYALPYIRS